MSNSKKVDPKLYDIYWDKLKCEGWENIRQFTDGAKVPFSLETTRRLFSDHDDKNVAPITIAIVGRHLGFTPKEIKGFLKKYTTDQDIWPMLGESETPLTQDEEALLKAYRALKDTERARGFIADQLDMVAMAVSIDVSKYTKIIRRKR